jgi:hypothetical protein
LNQAQQAAAATVGARFANPFPVFNPQGDDTAETATICALTFICASGGDGHPSDAGYRALADIVWETYLPLPAARSPQSRRNSNRGEWETCQCKAATPQHRGLRRLR